MSVCLDIHWILDIQRFELVGLDGLGFYRFKTGLEMDLDTVEWTIVGHFLFGFGRGSAFCFFVRYERHVRSTWRGNYL
jgi:hypothetical protein